MTTAMHGVKLTSDELDGLNSARATRVAKLTEQAGWMELLLDPQGEKAQQAFEDGEHGASDFTTFTGFQRWLTDEAAHARASVAPR